MWRSKRTCYQVLVEYNVDSPTIRANAKKSKLLGHIMLLMSDNIIHPSAQHVYAQLHGTVLDHQFL